MAIDPSLIKRVQETFTKSFGLEPDHLVQAPGRVNLIGEFTDYNDGFVLPCAINFHTVIAAGKRDDNKIRVIAVDFGAEENTFDLTEEIVRLPSTHWANYVRGVAKCLKDAGHEFGGANLVISGNVPQGAGLSSSASLEVALCHAFNTIGGLELTAQEIALLGQKAENSFVGCNCGIMDQLISACGETDHALLIDCRSLETFPAKIPEGLAILIVNSNRKRELVDSEYNIRRQQCEQAAVHHGVPALRDVDMDTFVLRQDEMDPVVAKRARHIISENDRTQAAAKALTNGDMAILQDLMRSSHLSMQHDFEVTVREIDTLVDIIKGAVGEAGGVRMTGGGFGGCVVSLLPEEMVDQVVSTINAKYPAATGLEPSIYICSAEQGAGLII